MASDIVLGNLVLGHSCGLGWSWETAVCLFYFTEIFYTDLFFSLSHCINFFHSYMFVNIFLVVFSSEQAFLIEKLVGHFDSLGELSSKPFHAEAAREM